MKERCIVIPAVKKHAVIPDQLIKRLAGVTLMERAIHTARGVLPGEDIIVLTDSQEISLLCERAGVRFYCRPELRFTSLDIVASMGDLLAELAQSYQHCIILRASCPLLTWVDVEDAWKCYLAAGAGRLVTVRAVRQRIWNVRHGNLHSLLEGPSDVSGRPGGGGGQEQDFVVESRALLIQQLSPSAPHSPLKTIPYFLNERAIEIQNYQDWWICERLLLRRHLVFVVAGWPAIGMGHVYRALMLATR